MCIYYQRQDSGLFYKPVKLSTYEELEVVSYHAIHSGLIARRFSNKSNAGRFLIFIYLCALWTCYCADDETCPSDAGVGNNLYPGHCKSLYSIYSRLTNMIIKHHTYLAAQVFLTSVPRRPGIGTLVIQPSQTSFAVLSDVINDSYNYGKQVCLFLEGCGLINYILSLCSYSG
jgi:hypothetical protein